MFDFLASREATIGVIALAVVALIALASRRGKRHTNAKGGDGAVYPYSGDAGSAHDCGGDGGGCD